MKVVEDIHRMLDLVSTASRLGKDVLSMAPVRVDTGDQTFDVFLCHNSEDKPIGLYQGIQDLGKIIPLRTGLLIK